MQIESWEQVKELLDEILEIEPFERRNFLNNADISEEVRAEVESLLGFEEQANDLMKMPAIEFSKDFFAGEEDGSSLIGQQIGVYRIIGELGYGGMGAVYLAERSDGKFEQKVALKMLKREMNTSTIRRRFQMEAEILASLEHPNIARLLDTGTTDDKTPYLAMEYIEGIPLDNYCNKENLNINERLDIFRQVCAAVNFAHRNLIVHRDLKPSNILVTKEGIPKLLDFGISKIISKEFEQANSATVTKLGAMTPGYASPEQLQRESVTTSTDIYSLGIILYELLSGHRPFEEKEDNLKDIFHAVLENEPPPPSAKVKTPPKTVNKTVNPALEDVTEMLPEENAEISTIIRPPENRTVKFQNRYTIPKTFHLTSSSLRGDLDNIVLKALRKEPERRYSSAENFAEDIHRYQRGLPVTARPNTFFYRAEKFAKRNSLAVIVGSLGIMALIFGVIATLWQANIAKSERIKAEQRFDDVRTLANSFIFEFSPKIENLPGSTPARELLVKRALEYLDNLAGEAGDDVELQRELAAAYEKVGDVQGNPYGGNLGDTKGALESYEKSKVIRQKLLENDPNNLKTQDDLANIYKLLGQINANGGDQKQAEGFLDQALELREKIVAQNPQDFEFRAKLAELLRSRGLIPFFEGDNKKAIEYYLRAKEISEKLYAEQPENMKVAEQYFYIFVAIGEAQGWDNDFESSGKNLQIGLEKLILLAQKHPNELSLQRSLMLAHNKRAENYQDLEEFEKSVEIFSKSVPIAENMLRTDPQSFQAKNDVAITYKKLAQALDDAGRSKESIEKLTLALNLFKEMSAADPKNTEYPYNVANTRYSIGKTYTTLKDHEMALKTFLQANEEFKAVLETYSKNIYAIRMSAFNFEDMGKTYIALAEKRNRHDLLQKAMESFQSALDNFKKLKAEGNLGEVDSGKISELENEIEKTAGMLRK